LAKCLRGPDSARGPKFRDPVLDHALIFQDGKSVILWSSSRVRFQRNSKQWRSQA